LPAKYRPADWSSQWVAPPFASEIAALDTTVAEQILLAGDALPDGTELLPLEEDDEGIAIQFTESLAVLPDEGLDLRAHLLEIERKLVTQALARSAGVVAHAARLLGLRRTTLVEKLRKLGMLNAAMGAEATVNTDAASED
jgi:DNA-binding NtrC family response regulator